MSGDNGVVIRVLTGSDTVTGTEGIKMVTPTPTRVTAGTVGKMGAGKVITFVCVAA